MTDVCIGAGGSGEVSRRVLSDGTIVAVKKFDRGEVYDENCSIEAHKLQAIASALLPYPHIASLVPRYISHTPTNPDPKLYLEMVMEYCDERPVGNMKLTMAETRRMLLLVVDALVNIQSIIPGFVHDDFHNSNVLVDTAVSRVRIIDFLSAFQMPGSTPRVILTPEDAEPYAFDVGCNESNASIYDICYMIFHTCRSIKEGAGIFGDEDAIRLWLALASAISINCDDWYQRPQSGRSGLGFCFTLKPGLSMDDIRFIIRNTMLPVLPAAPPTGNCLLGWLW